MFFLTITFRQGFFSGSVLRKTFILYFFYTLYQVFHKHFKPSRRAATKNEDINNRLVIYSLKTALMNIMFSYF